MVTAVTSGHGRSRLQGWKEVRSGAFEYASKAGRYAAAVKNNIKLGKPDLAMFAGIGLMALLFAWRKKSENEAYENRYKGTTDQSVYAELEELRKQTANALTPQRALQIAQQVGGSIADTMYKQAVDFALKAPSSGKAIMQNAYNSVKSNLGVL